LSADGHPFTTRLCKLNSLPFNATGEKIQRDGTWCVYEFTWQMDAILFWRRTNAQRPASRRNSFNAVTQRRTIASER
jgi:hypothetical protein